LNEYVLEGHRFILNNAILLLHRILQYPDIHTDASPRSTLPVFSSLIPFDASGAYLLEVKIRLSDGINPALVNTGHQEMERLRTMLRGVVDLNVPDRLALDTRVR
jgi:mediator of RNA polymerase II transcription subunit 18